MKRTFSFFLAVLMMLPLFGCASAPSENTQQQNIEISSGEELIQLATDPASYSKVVAADDAYIRDGSYANHF